MPLDAKSNVVAFRPWARRSRGLGEPSPIERISLLQCRLCGAACTAEGAVFVLPEEDGVSGARLVLAGVCGAAWHGVAPWCRAFPAVRRCAR